MYLIFGTIYNLSNVIVMQIVPQKAVAKQIVENLNSDKDLQNVNWHIHPVNYSQDTKQGISNIKSTLRSINANRIATPRKRARTLMPNAEKQMLNKFSSKRKKS